MNKRLLKIVHPRERHWVGDGFHVSTLFSPSSEDYKHITPFIMLDHAPAEYFPPTDKKLGVGEHPHRGFETVTFAIKGEITHRDSGGGGGTIQTGGVQWMSAASGVVHDEFHSENFSREGGEFEMVQLWVNLPAKNKMDKPRYQSMDEQDIPTVFLNDGKIKAKVVAGSLENTKGAANTFTPINIYELEASEKNLLKLELPIGSNTLMLQLQGNSEIEGKTLAQNSIALFERDGQAVEFELEKGAKILLLNGEPIDEPLACYGPFVMNTRQEIMQAIEDFQNGKMGQLVNEN